ncbi:MAG: hypothetical protein FWH18_03140 [Marinilabiliaceae bacterium]|nr:hypothetical protein [Marinilabiliaceae bacterium]
MREEELKNSVATEFFGKFDCDKILGFIDFAVKLKLIKNAIEFPDIYFLWAEAKQKITDIISMLTQLVLTIGKARTFDKILPPMFLGCFDCEKIAFIPYSDIQDIFYQNDFNWKVAPSNKETKEFKQIYTQIDKILNQSPWNTFVFNFEKDEKELKKFISKNFIAGKTETSKLQIDKNNFLTIYNKWLEIVKPTIAVEWDLAKKSGIIDGDFYIADLLSTNNETISDTLHVLLKSKYYQLDKKKLETGFFVLNTVGFNDNQKAHDQFWAIYKRPPAEEYWGYITDRRDLIVPQDVRERKGSFYTPTKWVELSQKYLADVFGVDWQDEYYVWDCAAGTGNLIVGLTNKYNIWASTLDKQDVAVMKNRIKNGANLLESHVFQFDFLNDDFSQLPKSLQDIINDPKLCRKLIIYINPPYAEAGSKTSKDNKSGVAKIHKMAEKYKKYLGKARNELFAQFLTRIYLEIPESFIANFSTLKNLQSQNFIDFRQIFLAKLEKIFLIPANSFDNVKGQFPIGFFIWNTGKKDTFKKVSGDVFGHSGNYLGNKFIYCGGTSINDWIFEVLDEKNKIGHLSCRGSSDFQGQNSVFINSHLITATDRKNRRYRGTLNIDTNNLIKTCVFFAVRHCIPATWLNDRDQFLFPNNKWKKDENFQNDCLAYTLFHSGNNISIKYGVNHWIPFSEIEVNAKERFESHFMISFISGIVIPNAYSELFEQEENKFCTKREFSTEATKVFDAGRELWKYYHAQQNININASLYDIREYFQGRNEKGKMNNKSQNETYNALMENLRTELKILAQKIEPKVYEYGFLLK